MHATDVSETEVMTLDMSGPFPNSLLPQRRSEEVKIDQAFYHNHGTPSERTHGGKGRSLCIILSLTKRQNKT